MSSRYKKLRVIIMFINVKYCKNSICTKNLEIQVYLYVTFYYFFFFQLFKVYLNYQNVSKSSDLNFRFPAIVAGFCHSYKGSNRYGDNEKERERLVLKIIYNFKKTLTFIFLNHFYKMIHST